MSTIKSSAENLTLNADGANNDIKFQSNGSEVASIDQAGTITATNFTGTGGNLTVKSDGTTPAIILRDSDNNIDGMFKALNGTVGMQVAGGDWALLATTNAEISLYHDNAVKLATSALGVTVTGGVSLGGTAAANTLDDYETGTFTATLTATSSAPNTACTATGYYTKVGNRVHFTIHRFNNVDTTGASGEMRVTGLPFSVGESTVTTNFATHSFDFDTARFQWWDISGTEMSALQSQNGGTWTDWHITAGSGKYLSLEGSYQAS